MSTFSSLFFPISVVVTNDAITTSLAANWNTVYSWFVSNSAYATGVPATVSNIFLSAANTNNYTLSSPSVMLNGTFLDGARYIYRLYQPDSGSNITVSLPSDNTIRIPSSINGNLSFSTTTSKFDVLALMYNKQDNKWDVISFVPGYSYP